MTSPLEKRARSSVSCWSHSSLRASAGTRSGWSAGTGEARGQWAHPGAPRGQSYRGRCDPDCRAGRLRYSEFADHGCDTRIAPPWGFVMTNPDLPGGRREEPAPGPGRATPGAGPAVVTGVGPAPGASSGEAPGPDGMPPGPAGYEIRFRLAGWEALGPPFGLLFLAAGIFAPEALYVHVVLTAGGGFLIVPYVIMLARRTAVFRADQAGITLGPEVPMRQFSAQFSPGQRSRRSPCTRSRAGAGRRGSSRGPISGSCPVARRRPGQPAGSTPGGWTAGASPLSPQRRRPASASSRRER